VIRLLALSSPPLPSLPLQFKGVLWDMCTCCRACVVVVLIALHLAPLLHHARVYATYMRMSYLHLHTFMYTCIHAVKCIPMCSLTCRCYRCWSDACLIVSIIAQHHDDHDHHPPPPQQPSSSLPYVFYMSSSSSPSPSISLCAFAI
jgi:hypothetical protein